MFQVRELANSRHQVFKIYRQVVASQWNGKDVAQYWVIDCYYLTIVYLMHQTGHRS